MKNKISFKRKIGNIIANIILIFVTAVYCLAVAGLIYHFVKN